MGENGIGDEIAARLDSLNIVATPPSDAVLLWLLYRLQPRSNEDNKSTEKEDEGVTGDELNKKRRSLSVAKIEVNTVNVMIAQVDNDSGKKVATASIESLKSTTHFEPSGDVRLEGKIGSIHMLDLAERRDWVKSHFCFERIANARSRICHNFQASRCLRWCVQF